MRKALIAISAFVFVAVVSTASQAQSNESRVNALLSELRSEKWTERASAYQQLRSDTSTLRQAQVRSALLDLLDRENHLTGSNESGVDPDSGEDYAEYVSALVDTVDSLADWKSPVQVCILAHAAFDPDSRFATKLVATDQLVLPCLVKMTESKSAVDRYKAAALLVRIGAGKDKLTLPMSQRIHEITIAALRDPNDMVRTGTVHALAEFGVEDMIPALRQVAETDPAPEVQGYSIRKMATEAIGDIQKRTHK